MNLEPHLARWREEMSRQGLGPGAVRDELESHLRDSIESAIRRGIGEDLAASEAIARLGTGRELHREFGRAVPASLVSRAAALLFPANLRICAVGSIAPSLFFAANLAILPWLRMAASPSRANSISPDEPSLLDMLRGGAGYGHATFAIIATGIILGIAAPVFHLCRPRLWSAYAVTALWGFYLWYFAWGLFIFAYSSFLSPLGFRLYPIAFHLFNLICVGSLIVGWHRRMRLVRSTWPQRPHAPGQTIRTGGEI